MKRDEDERTEASAAQELTITGYDPDRPGWLGKYQAAECSRCLREVSDDAPHLCTLNPADHATCGPACPYSPTRAAVDAAIAVAVTGP
jgi:hypothetical protein